MLDQKINIRMLKQCFVFAFLCLSFSIHSEAQSLKLSKTKVNDYITVFLPDDFSLMSERDYAREYGAYKPALAMYTSSDALADFGVNMAVNRSLKAYSESGFKTEDLKMLKGMYKGSIAAMHSEVEFIKDQVKTINKKEFIVLEFVGTVRDEKSAIRSSMRARKQYSYIMYTVQEERILIFNFTCPYQVKHRWEESVQKMMESVKVGDF